MWPIAHIVAKSYFPIASCKNALLRFSYSHQAFFLRAELACLNIQPLPNRNAGFSSRKSCSQQTHKSQRFFKVTPCFHTCAKWGRGGGGKKLKKKIHQFK